MGRCQKVPKKCQNLTFKVNFLCQKLSESFSFLFSLKNINLGACFLLLSLLKTLIFEDLYLLKSCLWGSCWKILKWYLMARLHCKTMNDWWHFDLESQTKHVLKWTFKGPPFLQGNGLLLHFMHGIFKVSFSKQYWPLVKVTWILER